MGEAAVYRLAVAGGVSAARRYESAIALSCAVTLSDDVARRRHVAVTFLGSTRRWSWSCLE
jgi:hypothetical protein